ncbi:hypothetical protein PHYPO_G00137770 [Pangasianodon hypophthalmus]|uniref:Ig-like domain-containing protein n=1 Tax=Pangasianodon hypophthalmus TaxID=310915 RepID=A0A5N5KD17_PANHP|nr:hypothetical protein PHYPO_G00137770 [Pangasianodon hypophthalmus]
MQSCSIHHCVLFFLTLTFTTEPTLALTSVMVKLNQSAGLPCEQNCSGSLKWTVIDKPSDIVAQCDQASCSSDEGFYISHERYEKGDLSLTITVADYSKRNTYTCACDGGDIVNTVRLSIEPRTLFIHLKPGKDLVLNLHMPGQIVVTYRSKESPDQYGEPFCTVDKDGLDCKAEYKPRTSLSHSNLILEKVTLSDSGVYTVWDKNNNEINLSYYVSVKEPLVDPLIVKLHESVNLPCNMTCQGLGKWTKLSRGSVAWCNQTSCWSDKGYNISYSKFLQGDFSLTITADDYSMRGLYTCECDDMDIRDHRVVIEPKISSVQLKPGDNLLMDLPLTEPVKVVYQHSMIFADDPAGKDICTLQKGSLECIDAYTHRISSVLKMGNVNLNDSGDYIIKSKEGQEVFLIYNVSVKGDQPTSDKELCVPSLAFGLGVPALIIVGGALALLAVCIYQKCKKSHLQDEHVGNEDMQSVSTCCFARYTRNSGDPSTSSQLMKSEEA